MSLRLVPSQVVAGHDRVNLRRLLRQVGVLVGRLDTLCRRDVGHLLGRRLDLGHLVRRHVAVRLLDCLRVGTKQLRSHGRGRVVLPDTSVALKVMSHDHGPGRALVLTHVSLLLRVERLLNEGGLCELLSGRRIRDDGLGLNLARGSLRRNDDLRVLGGGQLLLLQGGALRGSPLHDWLLHNGLLHDRLLHVGHVLRSMR